MRSSFSSWAVLLLLSAAALGQEYPKPDAGYVTDLAGVLSDAQEERIEQWLLRVETKSRTEIIVVTIPTTGGATIESYATGLFNAWGIGNMPKNDGILLLIAVGDRRARIELGDGHPVSRDAEANRIMEGTILPRFRSGDYPGGITRGVKAIVNEFTTTRIGVPWRLLLIPAALIACVLIAVSLFRSGKRGWGWVFVGLALVLLALLLRILVEMLRMRRSRSRGWRAGGLGGFGGGFSRGRGATGSW
jgi:uncharacterized protein